MRQIQWEDSLCEMTANVRFTNQKGCAVQSAPEKENMKENGKLKIKEEGLIGNEKIEEAIAALQQEPTEELLAHALTTVRRRMRENGQVIVAVEPQAGDGPLQIQAIQTSDGKNWWMVFTSFEEEVKGSGSVMSTFLTDIGQLLREAGKAEGISGVIFNPWNRTLMLDQQLIRIILGENTEWKQ